MTAETPNRRGEVRDPGAAVLLDDAGDVLLALLGEDVAGAASGRVTTVLLRVAADSNAVSVG